VYILLWGMCVLKATWTRNFPGNVFWVVSVKLLKILSFIENRKFFQLYSVKHSSIIRLYSLVCPRSIRLEYLYWRNSWLHFVSFNIAEEKGIWMAWVEGGGRRSVWPEKIKISLMGEMSLMKISKYLIEFFMFCKAFHFSLNWNHEDTLSCKIVSDLDQLRNHLRKKAACVWWRYVPSVSSASSELWNYANMVEILMRFNCCLCFRWVP